MGDEAGGTVPMRAPGAAIQLGRHELGRVVVQPEASDVLTRSGLTPAHVLGRHLVGDHGTADATDRSLNAESIRERNGPVWSYYTLSGGMVWVCTSFSGGGVSTTITIPDGW